MSQSLTTDLMTQIKQCRHALRQGKGYFFRVNQESFETGIFEFFIFEIYQLYPPAYLREHLKFIVSNDATVKHRLECCLITASLKYLQTKATDQA